MESGFDTKLFRQALSTFPTGVTIVTTVDMDGNDVGVTANSFNSVSLTPPMILWSLGRTSTNIATFLAARHFAVHILAGDQDALATRFAQRGVDRFANLRIERGVDGIPLLDGCAAQFTCKTASRYEAGDHVILVGEVLKFLHCEHEPLVFARGRFTQAIGKDPPASGIAASSPLSPSGALERDLLVQLLSRAYHQLYLRIKPEIERRNLTETEYLALKLLDVHDGRTPAELEALLAYSGLRVTERVVQRLAELAMIELDERSQGEIRLQLSSVGRRSLIELLAITRAASAHAERILDPSESRVLRQLLASVIEASDPAITHSPP